MSKGLAVENKCNKCGSIFQSDITICPSCKGTNIALIISPGKKGVNVVTPIKNLIAIFVFTLPSFISSLTFLIISLILLFAYILFFLWFIIAIINIIWAIIGLVINSINYESQKSKWSLQNISISLALFAIVFSVIDLIVGFVV